MMLLKFTFVTLNILSDSFFLLLWILSPLSLELLRIEIDLMTPVHFSDHSNTVTDKSANEELLVVEDRDGSADQRETKLLQCVATPDVCTRNCGTDPWQHYITEQNEL
ncbi:hypothetical protein AVEN_275771-1 [Araneus ventricosus]|uniref:Uncharacterized protein n=1 Tax=Araneus ventricosus TaxID=182803 RepID=A0A4Y2HEM3_ARAVE|nr:hypothetical protein AVEN_275771-1 [Araneus ventricosus]